MVAAKRWAVALLTLALVLLGSWAWTEHRAHVADKAAWELATQGQVQLNKNVSAKLASATLERDSLAELVKGASKIGGKLIAGATLTVLKHDTTIVHDTLSTQLTADSSRVAQFRDSTFAGIVSGTVTAPPCCAPLSMMLAVQRPEFRPQIGVVQVGTRLAIEVNWQGEQVRIDNAYALPLPTPPKRVTPWIEGSYGVLSNSEVRAGIDLRLLGVRVGPSVAQPLASGQRPQLFLTGRWEF